MVKDLYTPTHVPYNLVSKQVFKNWYFDMLIHDAFIYVYTIIKEASHPMLLTRLKST